MEDIWSIGNELYVNNKWIPPIVKDTIHDDSDKMINEILKITNTTKLDNPVFFFKNDLTPHYERLTEYYFNITQIKFTFSTDIITKNKMIANLLLNIITYSDKSREIYDNIIGIVIRNNSFVIWVSDDDKIEEYLMHIETCAISYPFKECETMTPLEGVTFKKYIK